MLPGYVATSERLNAIRERRRLRSIFTALVDGRWRSVLLGMRKSQYFFGPVRNNAEKIDSLLTSLNLLRLAVRMHTTVLTGRPASISIPDGFEPQMDAMAALRERVLMDTLLQRTVYRALRDAEAYALCDVDQSGSTIELIKADQVLCVGPDGHDGQPTVIERRWIIKKTDSSRRERTYLRVERHRPGTIEHELYLTNISDVIQPLQELKRVPLATALDAPPADIVQTGIRYPLITRIVTEYDDDRASGVPLLTEHDIEQLDSMTAAISRLHRALELHGQPKLKISDDQISPEGEVMIHRDAVADPDGTVEYLTATFDLANMITVVERMLEWSLMLMQMSPSLLGSGATAGDSPITAEQVRTEATATRAFATGAANYIGPAWGRVLTICGELEARTPGNGFAVAPVRAVLRPELPKDWYQRMVELAEAKREGLIDSYTALAELWGEEMTASVMAGIEEDQSKAADMQARALFAGFGGAPGATGGAA